MSLSTPFLKFFYFFAKNFICLYFLRRILAVYSAGIPFNIIHSISTAVIVALIQPPVTEKLERIKIKYGIFAEKSIK